MLAPFPFFGGKRSVVDVVWQRFGAGVRQYIEPFCGSAAVLLAAREPVSLEVIGDANGFVANFWRAVKHDPAEVARAADYPVSHVDLGARHAWLMERRPVLAAGLLDAEWPGDARAAGWWLWGQCSWIGSGWAEWGRAGRIPHVSNAGRGVQAAGRIPHVSNLGSNLQSQAARDEADAMVDARGLLTTGGKAAWIALHKLASRLERVRVVHGDWNRCLNHHYGKERTAVFLDPPYRAFEALYSPDGGGCVADAVEAWARDHAHLRVALCGHAGDYPSLAGWDEYRWERDSATYGGVGTKANEAIYFSPACEAATGQALLFGGPHG